MSSFTVGKGDFWYFVELLFTRVDHDCYQVEV